MVDPTLERIARTYFHIPTLRRRGRDDLDVHALDVLALHRALEAAWRAGAELAAAGIKPCKPHCPLRNIR